MNKLMKERQIESDSLPINERFYESRGICPQTVLCEFASASLARTFVKPPPSQSRRTLSASGTKGKN